MRPLRNAYFALFTAARDTMRVLAMLEEDDAGLVWRGLGFLSFVQLLAILSGSLWAEIAWGGRPILTRAECASLYVGVVALNYVLLVHRGNWAAYARDFRHQPASQQLWVKRLARGAIVMVIGIFGATMYIHWLWGGGRS